MRPLFMITTWLAGALDVGEQVRGDDDVHAFLAGDVADELEHLLAAGGVHARGGLVEQQQPRVVHQRLGQLQPLLHAGGIGLHQAVARLLQPDVIQDVVGPFHGLLARHAAQFAQVGGQGDGVHARDQAVALGHVADAAAQRLALVAQALAHDLAAAGVGLQEAEQQLHQRGLAGAVGAEQAEDAGGQGQRHVADGLDVAVAEADVFQPDDFFHGFSLDYTQPAAKKFLAAGETISFLISLCYSQRRWQFPSLPAFI